MTRENVVFYAVQKGISKRRKKNDVLATFTAG